jgi:hypothetical protein
MKLRNIKYYALGLALAAGLTSAVNATLITYDWEQATTTLPGYTSSGTLVLNTSGDTVSSISFTENNASLLYTGTVLNFTGTATILAPGAPHGDAQLNGFSMGTQTPPIGGGPFGIFWVPNAATSSPTEQLTFDNTIITGAWVPVPEPTTLMAGAMLLLPFGASTLRSLRKSRSA